MRAAYCSSIGWMISSVKGMVIDSPTMDGESASTAEPMASGGVFAPSTSVRKPHRAN